MIYIEDINFLKGRKKIVKAENKVILLEILFFLLISLCFYSKSELLVIGVESLLILSMLALSVSLYEENRGARVQLFWLNLIFLILWSAGIFCTATNKGNYFLIFVGECGFMIGTFRLGGTLLKTVKKWNVGKYKAIFCICVVFAVLSFETLTEVPMYDSGAYYSWSISKLASNFDFTCRNILDYCLAGHISVGYGIFTLIGELISPGTAIGIHVVNLILAICSIIAFNKSLELLFPNQTRTQILLATGLYAFAPNMLGMVGTINIDVPGIYFFVILWYCGLKKYRALELFFAWVFVCTKEPNVIYYAFYVMGVILVEIRDKTDRFSAVKVFFREAFSQIFRIVPIIFWMVYYIAPGRSSWVAGTEGLLNANGIHTFGLSVGNIAVKIKELLIFNGSWIFTVFILVSILATLFYKKTMICLDKLLPLLFAVAGTLIFNFFYLDYPHPRYISIGVIIFSILAILTILSMGKTVVLSVGMCMGLSFLLAQSFITIDPLTYMNYPTINYSGSSSKLVTTGGYKLDDASVYNRESSYWGRLWGLILEQAGYDSDTIIVFPSFENIPRAYGYTDNMHWNYKKKRIQTSDSAETIPILIANNEEEVEHKKVLYIIPFYAQEGECAFLTAGTSVDVFEVSFRTLRAKCYLIQ